MVKGGGLKLFSQSVRPSVNVDIIVHVSTQAPPMDSRVKKSFYQLLPLNSATNRQVDYHERERAW